MNVSLRPFLDRMAKRVLQGKPLPAHFTVRDLDYAAQGELERFLGNALGAKGGWHGFGRVSAALA